MFDLVVGEEARLAVGFLEMFTSFLGEAALDQEKRSQYFTNFTFRAIFWLFVRLGRTTFMRST